jgi:hypothetical protein
MISLLLRQQEKRTENLIKFGGILCYFELNKMLKFRTPLMVTATDWERERESVPKAATLISKFTVTFS